MSLLDRLNLLIRSNINDAGSSISRGSNPVREMESSLRDAKTQLKQLRQNEQQLVGQIRDARAKAEQWEDRAIMALKHGDEQLAKEAIIVKNQSLRQAQQVRDRLEDHRRYMHDIERSLEALQMKLESTQSRSSSSYRPSSSSNPSSSSSLRDERNWDDEFRRRLSQRGQSAPSSSSAFESTLSSAPTNQDEDGSFSTSDTFQNFDRMSDKISNLEARVAATEELSMEDIIDPRKKELDAVFKKMEDTKKTDDDLSDLKKKFS